MRIVSILSSCLLMCSVVASAQQDLATRTVVSGLRVPWEILWGPDNSIWMTERGGLVSTVNPESGAKKQLLDLRAVVSEQLEGGLLGMVLHPNFADSPHVFLAYVSWRNGDYYKTVQRYTYHNDTLTDPVEIFLFEPAAVFHQGCRLLIDSSRHLFITQGDSFNASTVQDDASLLGKILRLNIDGSIPADNPIPGNPMFTKGHRNPQGLCMLPNGVLAESEHGNDIEDEVNILEAGRNYGWPKVEGPCDQDSEKIFCAQNNVREPLWSTGPSTFATAGLTWYDHDRFPSLRHSLLETCLKSAKIVQIKLDSTFTHVIEVHDWFPYRYGRLRDACVSPDGRIFICTSNRDGVGKNPFPREDDDKILELIPIADTAVPTLAIAGDTARAYCLVGDTATFYVNATNVGSAPLLITNVYMYGAGGQFFASHVFGPFSIAPGRSYPVRCTFVPNTDGPIHDAVVLHMMHNGAETIHEFPVVGSTNAGVLKASIDTLVLNVDASDNEEGSFTITNIGTTPVVYKGVTISGGGKQFTTASFEGDSSIAPQEQRLIEVQASPIQAGFLTANVDVQSSGYKQPRVTVRIVSTATSVRETPFNEQSLVLSPNPVTETLSITLPSELVTPIEVRTILGSVVAVLHSAGATSSIDVSALAPGVYSVSSFIGGRRISVPFIKQ
ncbi:hypothetical protein BH10BAC6_BH10BAC6_05080 [soil metagenome]